MPKKQKQAYKIQFTNINYKKHSKNFQIRELD